MILNTLHFGDMEINEKNIIHFPEGILGFDDIKKYVLLSNHDTEEPVPFMWLQSVDNPELAFVLTIPFFIKNDYEIQIPNDVIEKLKISAPEDIGLYSIVRVSDNFAESTTNLQAPLVINSKNLQAIQLVLNNDKYNIRENIVSDTEDSLAFNAL